MQILEICPLNRSTEARRTNVIKKETGTEQETETETEIEN